MFKNKRGQSTVEYIVLVTAVIGAVYIFATGTLNPKLTETMNTSTEQIGNMANRLNESVAESDKGPDPTVAFHIKVADSNEGCLEGKHFDATEGRCVGNK